jgi:hypothetical protein
MIELLKLKQLPVNPAKELKLLLNQLITELMQSELALE